MVTLQRVSGGSLGIAINVNQLTAVHPGGAGEAAGLQVGDWIAEVNGKDLLFGSFGSLIPKDLTAPINCTSSGSLLEGGGAAWRRADGGSLRTRGVRSRIKISGVARGWHLEHLECSH